MRTINVHASHSLGSLPSSFWSSHQGHAFRPALNIRAFVGFLKTHFASSVGDTQESDSEEVDIPSNGRKRAAAVTRRSRPSKRARMADKAEDGASLHQILGHILSSWPEAYHAIPLPQSPFAAQPNLDQKPVPALIRTDTIRYTVDATERRPKNWSKEEELLKEVLTAVAESYPQSDAHILGNVKLISYLGRVVALSPHNLEWLFVLPLEADEDSDEDILSSCLVVEAAQQLMIEATLRLTILPPDARDASPEELPLRIEVETCCSLLLPALHEQPRFRAKAAINTAADALRRCLNYFYPSGTEVPGPFKGVIDVPYLYSILNPAPPLPSAKVDAFLQPKALVPKLLPFQRRSVAWLLAREGKTFSPSGKIAAVDTLKDLTDSPDTLFFFWRKVEEANETWYFNRLSGDVSRDPPEAEGALGGILAEEPGLGKTLETISLILLNPAPERNPKTLRWDPSARIDVGEIKTTLIVTPVSLASQWEDELAKHAPSLKVLIYQGWAKLKLPTTAADAEKLRAKLKAAKEKKAAKKTTKSKSSTPVPSSRGSKGGAPETEEEVIDWPSYVNTFDVVITTYPVLRSEINVARAPMERARREVATYRETYLQRSPLVSVEWLRVVMDEVQMAGGGKIEDMVSLIPRLSSLAVSGTPAKGQVSDLIHVLRFLRIDHLIGGQKAWARLLQPSHIREFAAFFRYFAVRTLKSAVKNELTIPTQTRYLVPITLGRVERHVYDQNFETTLLQLGLDARGVAASSGWEPDSMVLRNCLRRLRGICTHPQVGQVVTKNADKFKAGSPKTMAEVLEMMTDSNWRSTLDDTRSKVNALVTQAQLLQMDRHNANRYNLALQVLEIAEQEGKALVETLKTAVAALEEQTKTNSNPDESPSTAMDTTDKGKGKAREVDVSDDEEEASEQADLSPNASQSTKKGALNNRLRDATITLHRVHFVLGDVYHILGRNAEEEASYASAEALRRNVLQASEKDAETSMADLMSRASDAGLEEDALLIELPFLTQGHKIREIEDRRRRARSSDRAAAGLSPLPSSSEEDSDHADSDLEVKKKKKKPKKPKRLSKVIEEVNFIVEEVLHKQANLIWQWRSRISELLTRRLTPGEGDGADGQEYQRSLDDQGEVESYMQAYSSLLADYREALTKERNLLAAHDARQKKTRSTKAAVKAIADEAPLKIREGVELNDAHHELHENLTFQRRDLLMDLNQRAVKSCLTEIRERIGKIKGANDPEKLLLLEASSMIQAVISEKNQLINKFETDLARFRKVFNYRVIYFAQLQEISDSVAQPTIETTLEDTIAEITTQLETLNLKINTGRSRDRYLKHLAEGGMEGQSVDDEERVCILCRCDFVRGYITQCAHIFCEPCLKLWTSRPEGKTCPVCRSAIEVQAMEAFTTTEIEKPAETSETQDNTVPKSRRVIEYNQIDPDLLTEIQAIKSFGDFGSKIQTLVKHLLYLQTTEPGSKSICFSAWSDSLLILERALKDNDIPCLRIDKNGHSAAQKFRTDPNIQVLLLHGERENAGLNVTCASRVFLLESVVHHGFEIQAIARIDRMGQTRSTEVFCYYAEETVERSILDLAARQGLSLYTKDNAAGTLNVTKFQGGNTQNPKSKEAKLKKSAQKGDFIGKVDDMLAVLFPHMYEDVEYLIDGNDTDVEDDADDDRMITSQMEIAAGTSTRAPRTRRPPQVNAEAGPSRLRR